MRCCQGAGAMVQHIKMPEAMQSTERCALHQSSQHPSGQACPAFWQALGCRLVSLASLYSSALYMIRLRQIAISQ